MRPNHGLITPDAPRLLQPAGEHSRVILRSSYAWLAMPQDASAPMRATEVVAQLVPIEVEATPAIAAIPS
jgi:hypothetical protein